MSWITALCNSAEDLGTLAENEPPTWFVGPTTTSSRRLMSNTPRSPRASSGPPNDFDYDDVTIGKTLLDACRRRADHSEEEGLSSCLSSSVSHDRTGRPVVCRLVILADCQAEIRKHEFQADYDRRSIQKLNETIESQEEEICRAHQGDERRRQDQQLLHEQLLKQDWDLREAHEKSLNEMEELKRFQG